jgi:hypothetical protein
MLFRSLRAFSALLLCVSPVAAQSLTPPEIAAQARPAVVLIKASVGGRALGQGSGFIVEPSGLIVSSLHVVSGADAIQVTTASGEVYDNVFFVSADRRKDIVVLKIAGSNLPSLRIGDEQRMAVGERVFVLGHPRGMEGTFSDGLLSAKRVDDGVAFLQITAPISQGSSGGPVLNEQGEVVGIATSIVREGQNLNLAVAARYARGIVAMGERPRPLSEVRTELATTSAPAAPAAPGRSSPPARTGSDELQRWHVEVLVKTLAVDSLMRLAGYRMHGDGFYGMLRRGGRAEHVLTLPAGTYSMVGVCDTDCTDLDLVLYSGSRTVASDLKLDAVPLFDVTVAARTTYRLVVTLPGCTTSSCYYGALIYRRE